MKNFLLLFFVLTCSLLVVGCNQKEKVSKESNDETSEKWIQLFNGKDLNDWNIKIKGYPLNENIHNTFRVEDGVIKVSYDQYDSFDESYGHLFYKQPFSSYKLKIQYRFTGTQCKGGAEWAHRNSGVMLHSQPPETMGIDQRFPLCVEVQMLGGIEEGVASEVIFYL